MGLLGAQGWRIWLWLWIKTDQSKYQWQTIKVADWMATWHPLTFPNQIRTLAGTQVGTVAKNTRSCAKSKPWKTKLLPIEILFSNCQVPCMDHVEHAVFMVLKIWCLWCSLKIGWLQIFKKHSYGLWKSWLRHPENSENHMLCRFWCSDKKSMQTQACWWYTRNCAKSKAWKT